MAEKSRIKYNPVTWEIEIEGTEEFVRDYFDRLQSIIRESAPGGIKKRRKVKKVTSEKVPRAGKEPRRARVGTKTRGAKAIVMKLVTEAGEKGISSSELQQKTGLSPRQIWSIIYRAEKEGKVTKERRGVYRIV